MKSFTTFDWISLLKYVAYVLVMCIMHSFTAVQRMHSCLPDSLIQMLDHEGKVLLAKGLIWLGQVWCLTSCLVICSWEGFRESLSLDLNSLLPLVKDGNWHQRSDLTKDLAPITRCEWVNRINWHTEAGFLMFKGYLGVVILWHYSCYWIKFIFLVADNFGHEILLPSTLH